VTVSAHYLITGRTIVAASFNMTGTILNCSFYISTLDFYALPKLKEPVDIKKVVTEG